ncbi:MAG TPA: SDR family oxidoreductase [Niabella sp.]|nr:SDR family oxidoreductase [Niabella sp.]HQW15000.1 SDR family oxidoreductase [Niabella sp.]HQX20108.1 SDR family oxidoreductase [Niabella sp.]HQX40380.1 SDR family oxidoreductase [Niabella sp.]HRB06713.1 SDR family oxidoreductase [Niabella sp.]
MNEYYNGKVVIVTGGTDGIGRALVNALLVLGAKVATCGRSYDKLYELQTIHASLPLHTMVTDVSVEADCKRFIESTLEVYGSVDILINNAGISMRGLFRDLELDVIKKVMDVNFFGALYCTKFALESLIEQKGTIVGISSIAGYRGLPGRTGYSASKFALQGFLESLKTELKDDEVHVMWVSPGFTSSKIRDHALNDKGDQQKENPMDEEKMMSAEDCAQHLLMAIMKKKRSLVLTITGKETVFLNRFFPSLADKLVHKFYFKDKKLIK